MRTTHRLSPIAPLLLATALAGLVGSGAARAGELDDIRSLLARGDAATALPRAERLAAAEPRNVQAEFLRGVALMDLQRNAEALALFEGLSQLHPELPDPWNNIALLHVRSGRIEAAREALGVALRNDPAHRTARANLGWVHLMLAAQAWEAVAAAGPLDPALARRLQAVRDLLAAEGR